ncbi:unnamed protein product [Moneuplotes crassus]|uniref:RING-type domain-containing protein n=1 Tax=Euplotes crassus TaxID=5936 RepID=A0AAD1XGG4_EUPCR|nr:unnamed protein product [Moneuplotes crassus]
MEMTSGEEERECMSCAEVLKKGDIAIKCKEQHLVCKECSESVVNTIFSNPEVEIPVKCFICFSEVDSTQIEKLMTPEQMLLYNFYYKSKKIDSTVEKLEKCPFCYYCEPWNLNRDPYFFYCKNDKCNKCSCTTCKQGFEYYPRRCAPPHLSEEHKNNVERHYKCYKYREIKRDWDQAIKRGTLRYCPGCGAGFTKDDYCLKITCKCKTVWCYFCGKKEEDLDKKDPNGKFYQHCHDWETNVKRCPLELKDLSKIDSKWDKIDDFKNGDLFHKILIYREIKAFFEKYTREEFECLCEAIPSVANHTFDIEEAMTMDLDLIKRKTKDSDL